MLKSTKKFLISIIIITGFFSINCLNVISGEEYITTDIDELKYKQEITIPIDTSLEISKYQPIDIKIIFNNPCWGKDETHHSVRVAYDDGTSLTEIESQIYDLEYITDTNIKSCGLVFLIPENANGNEKYYVMYDSSETNPTNYEDHIEVEDTHYFYEPISGQIIDFDYYGIKEDGDVIYAIVHKGELLENPVGLAVVKFKPGSKVVETYNLDLLGDFDLRYGINEEPAYYGTSWATDVTKQVLVDGNLMFRCRLKCTSPNGEMKSDNIYTYYYSPTDTKKIVVNTHHEVLKNIEIEDPSTLDGSLAGITSIKSRSASIEKMNVGEILPSVSLYYEDESILDFEIPSNPDTYERELVLSTKDDMDLGSKAWFCLSDPEIGIAHGMIFDSNKEISTSENDGLQLKAYVKENLKLPGLEADTGNAYITRNAYENGEHNTVLSKGESYDFRAQFITVEKEGVNRIDAESEIYQCLIKNVPILRENITEDKEEVERYSLKTNVHFAPSAPLGSLLSAALGKNIPYIYAELYKDNSFKSSGSVGRISLASIDFDLEGQNLLQKIRTIIGIFDWKNATFFKKIIFPDLEAGTYVVKIFKENPIFAKERQYIGFGIVNLEKDETIDIFCRKQGTIQLSSRKSGGDALEGVKFYLLQNNVIISDSISDINGSATINAPCFLLKPYTFRAIYNGFLIEEEEITFGLLNRFIDVKKDFLIDLYDLKLEIKDSWYFPLEVDVNPKLTSSDMIEPITINAEKIGDGLYEFSNIVSGKYILKMGYKSFILEEDVLIPGTENLFLKFPAEYEISFDVMNSYGNTITDGTIFVSRNNKIENVEINHEGFARILVPPGNYQISIVSEDKEIAKQSVIIRGNKELDIVSNQDSMLHNILILIGILLVLFALIFMFWKKDIYTGLRILAIALILIALVSPWWVLNGETESVETNAKTFLIPPKIVTVTMSDDAVGGEISNIPEEATMVLELIFLFLIITGLIIFISIFTKNKYRKTTTVFTILGFILLIVSIAVFCYAFSLLTEIGVGSYIGSGDIETTIPGVSESTTIPSNWGPGIGFYLGIITIICIVLYPIYKKFRK
jgi:hypothetical protein